jgi:hypothetical protein
MYESVYSQSRLLPFAATVFLVILSGCGGSNFNIAPVHGKVSVADKPLFQGRLMFAPIAQGETDNPGKPAFGTIDKNGGYRLTTFKKDDGAVVGEHWVTIINVEEDLPDGVPEFDRLTSPAKVKVVAGQDNEININVSKAAAEKLGDENR